MHNVQVIFGNCFSSFFCLLCRGYYTSLVDKSSNVLFYSGTRSVKCKKSSDGFGSYPCSVWSECNGSFEDIAQYNDIWIDDSPNARGELVKSETVTIPDEATA